MIRPDDLMAAVAAADEPAQTAGHAAADSLTNMLCAGVDPLAAADSLTQAAAAFPQVDPLSAAERALTLGGWLGDWSARAAGTLADAVRVSAAELFGAASTLGGGGACVRAAALLSESMLYQIVVLLLTASYLLLLYTNFSEVRLLTGSFGFDRNAGQRTLQKCGVIHGHFLSRCCVLGVAGVGVLAVRACDDWLPAGAGELLPPLWRQGFCMAAVAAVGAIALVQTLALRVIGQVTLTQSFVSTLLYVKQFHFALASLAALPFILLYALCPIGSGSGWLYLTVGLLSIIILLFLREIRSLFVAKNISNLHWILYLCTVEIAPVAFAVLMLIKHS